MADRSNCVMCDVIGNKIFCGYYDAAFMECSELEVCPGGLDQDDQDDDYFEIDGFEND